MNQQFGAGAIVSWRGTCQLGQNRTRRETHLDGKSARRIAAGRAGVITIRCPADAVIEIDVAGKAGVVVTGKEHNGRVWVVKSVTAHIAIVVTFPRDDIGIAPARAGSAAGELMMQETNFGHLIVAVLPEVISLRDDGKSARAGGVTGEIEAIRIDHGNALVHEIVG